MIEAGRGAGAIVNIASMNATVAFPMRLAYNAAKAAIVSVTLATFFGAVPRALVEAARIDGAGTLRTLRLIVLPLARPALVTVIVVQALWVWNEVLIAIIFHLSAAVESANVDGRLDRLLLPLPPNVPIVMAGMLIATIPMLVLYLVGQRSFIRGLTAGATKG
jgi:raffinose/stachyose/melibiose transport system permease protein